jgi:hypothetical protein
MKNNKDIKKKKKRIIQNNSEWLNIYNNIVTTANVASPYVTITPRYSARFAYYKNLFQQYKIIKIHYKFTPLVENGNYPMPLYCKIVTNDTNRPSLESLKETGNEVNQKKGLDKWFTSSGRQNDLNYWFDMNVFPSIILYYLPLQAENPGKKYTLKVTILIKFRYPLIPNEETTNILIDQNEKIDEEEKEKKEQEEDEHMKKINELEVKIEMLTAAIESMQKNKIKK